MMCMKHSGRFRHVRHANAGGGSGEKGLMDGGKEGWEALLLASF
jgi:hypothetical protein